jgi:hypothetical protein
VKDWQELPSQFGAQVDQQIPTTDEIHAGKRRVENHVLLGKHHHIAEGALHRIGMAVPLKKPGQPLRRDITRDVRGIGAGPCALDGRRVDIHADGC